LPHSAPCTATGGMIFSVGIFVASVADLEIDDIIAKVHQKQYKVKLI
jgi:hypothetical protein